jgi:hypothetical protein
MMKWLREFLMHPHAVDVIGTAALAVVLLVLFVTKLLP